MVETAHGERIVAIGETESRADRHSIAECAIVGMWLPRLTLVLAPTQWLSPVFNVRTAEYELLVRRKS
jgi:hypothetical protein